MAATRPLPNVVTMSTQSTPRPRRRVKTSTYVVVGAVVLAGVLVVGGAAVTGNLDALLQGIDGGLDSRQAHRHF